MATNPWSSNGTVSVVIPTIGRPSLRASVESAHHQSVPTEIIVVLDAPAQREAVQAMLETIPHVLLVTSGYEGAAAARNLGVEHASGDFVAYLDDDDLWVDEKLERQLDALSRADIPDQAVCLTATTFVRHRKGERNENVVPRMKFDPGREHISAYLVQREDLFYGRRFMQSSSILGPTALMKRVPWDNTLVKYEDWDLLCRLCSPEQGASVIQLDEPLVTVHSDSDESASAKPNWRASAVFYDRYRAHMSRKARADFVWTQILRDSLAERSLRGLGHTTRHLSEGLPHAASIVVGLSGVAGR